MKAKAPKKKPSTVFVEPPELEISDEALKLLVNEAIKLLEGHEVRNFDYNDQWYPISEDVKNIIDLQQKKSLETIDTLGEQIQYLEEMVETNYIYNVLIGICGGIGGLIIGLFVYLG